eukprot:TRINITY_DN16886_c0_g1_i1.p1 TRINITY_DN16886_c0_g1~~TRINITY_DN16886_c0_g1_i1.p1  ORF type:complete len:336 (+),score=100.81 TRINITY_DN16886_c0_g1_i1:56-1063(+)
MINFSTLSLKKPAKKGLLSNKTVPVLLDGFGDDDDSDDDGRDMIRRTMAANAKKSAKDAQTSKAQVEAEIPGLLDYDKKPEETPVSEVKQKPAASNQSKFIQAMKMQAEQREAEREMTNQRIISTEAKKTDHLYADVDAEIAPIATPVFIKKSEEARKRAAADAVIDAIDESRSAANIGFSAFNTTLLNKRTADPAEEEDKEREDYQDQLREYLKKKDIQRKQQRREKYQRLKEAQNQPQPEPEPEPEPEPAPKPVVEEQPPPKEAVEKTASTEDNSPPVALSTAETIKKLEHVDIDRRKRVLERRKVRMARRNNEKDIEILRDRFLTRKLQSMS